MPFRSRPRVLGIAEETLSFAIEAAADAHPNEMLGVLRGMPGEEFDTVGEEGLVVTDLLVIPGTVTGPVSASLQTNLVPNDNLTVGSLHSHPNGVLRPSDEDVATFGRGQVHIIVGAPYERDCWKAFDRAGEPRGLKVLDVELPDPESFFDFTQADIDEEMR